MDLLKKLFKGDKVIWIIFLFLCVVSIFEVFSASSTLTYKSGDHWHPITGHMIHLMVGFFVVLIAHRIPVKWYAGLTLVLPFSWILLFIVQGMALVNGAARWISVGGFQFQPSEFAKLGTIAMVAAILARFQREDQSADKRAIWYILVATGGSVLLIFSENLSTALLLAISVYLLMIVGRIPWKQMGILTAAVALVGLVCFSALKYVPADTWKAVHLERAITWHNRVFEHPSMKEIPPEKFDVNNDAQVAFTNIAIASSHIIGKGPGNSVQRDFLPQAYSDFIYAIIIEEWGLLGGAIVAFLYIWLLFHIARIARHCNNYYHAFLIIGFGFIIVTQAFFNMFVAVGIMPVTGQPLPLISRGGSSILVTCAYFGVILGVSRHVNDLKERRQREEDEKQQQVQQAAETILLNAAENIKVRELDEEAEQAHADIDELVRRSEEESE